MEKRNVNKHLVAILFVVVAVLGYGPIGKAGNLEPSAAPAPTMKTLDEVEPRIPIQSLSSNANAVYVIDQAGSYYFTGDVNATDSNKHGIQVDTNDVTIDLMGYALKGPDSGTKSGIYVDGCSNVEIRNGTIRDFGWDGIIETNTGNVAYGHRVLSVRVLSNGHGGIYLFGENHLVKDCSVLKNGDIGIRATGGSTVVGNTVSGNSDDGIFTTVSLVRGNTSFGNGGANINATGGSVIDNYAP